MDPLLLEEDHVGAGPAADAVVGALLRGAKDVFVLELLEVGQAEVVPPPGVELVEREELVALAAHAHARHELCLDVGVEGALALGFLGGVLFWVLV